MFGFGTQQNTARPKSREGIFILFDIGGTKMRVAVSKDAYSFEEPHIGKTPESFVEGVKLFEELVHGAANGRTIAMCAGGIAGLLTPDHTAIAHSPNLSQWGGKSLVATFSHLFHGAPVVLENDAALVGLGEAIAGAGQGSDIVMYMTVSTGVGGARIVSGEIDRAAVGFEPGRQIVDYKEKVTLEGLVSGRAIEKRFGVLPQDLSDQAHLEEIADEVSVGIANSIMHWSPEVVVLGGSLIVGARNTLSLSRIEAQVSEHLAHFPALPRIRKAALGDLGGLHGAMALIRSRGI